MCIRDRYTVDAAMPDHNAAVKFVLDALLDTDKGAIASLSELSLIHICWRENQPDWKEEASG